MSKVRTNVTIDKDLKKAVLKLAKEEDGINTFSSLISILLTKYKKEKELSQVKLQNELSQIKRG